MQTGNIEVALVGVGDANVAVDLNSNRVLQDVLNNNTVVVNALNANDMTVT